MHSLIAMKITGDDHVPAGKHTFKIINTQRQALPIAGIGQVAQRGFNNAQDITGRLVYVSEDYNAFAFEYSSRGTVIFVRRFLGAFISHTVEEELSLQLSDKEESVYTKVVRQIAKNVNAGLVHVPANLYEIGSARSASKSVIEQQTESVSSGDVANEECTICLGNLSANSATRIVQCKHVFHTECITAWLLRCNQCPICKCRIGANAKVKK